MGMAVYGAQVIHKAHEWELPSSIIGSTDIEERVVGMTSDILK